MKTLVLVVMLTCAGCMSSLISRPPVTETVALHSSPQEAYTRAVRAFHTMGGQVQMADAQARVISGVIHNAVQMNVQVQEDSTVSVRAQLLPGKLVVGELDEVREYMALLKDGTYAR